MDNKSLKHTLAKSTRAVLSFIRYTQMNKFGASFTNQIDSIGIREGECILSIIQAEPLSPELTVLLQEKLNHYLQYILDGQLHEERPDADNMQKTIELYLQHPAAGQAEEFLSKVKPYIESEGIKFTLIHSTLCVQQLVQTVRFAHWDGLKPAP